MAERLPGAAAAYANRSAVHPTQAANGINLHPGNYADLVESTGAESHGHHDMNSLAATITDSNGTASHLVVDGPYIASNRTSLHSIQGRFVESTRIFPNNDGLKSGARSPVEHDHEKEGDWVEQDELGVYIILSQLSNGEKDLNRVRFSRKKKFSESEAEKWWAENGARVYEQYNVRMVQRGNMNLQPQGELQVLENLYSCFYEAGEEAVKRNLRILWELIKYCFPFKCPRVD